MKRHIFLCHLPHPCVNLIQKILIYDNPAFHRTIIALADRKMNSYLVDGLPVSHIVYCFHQQQAHTSLISSVPDHTRRSLKTEGTVLLKSLKKLLKFTINKYQHNIILIIFLILFSDCLICSTLFVHPDLVTDPHLIHLFIHTPPLLFILLLNLIYL